MFTCVNLNFEVNSNRPADSNACVGILPTYLPVNLMPHIGILKKKFPDRDDLELEQ